MSEASNNKSSQDEFFKSISADDNEVTEIESLCVNCFKQGTTKMMLTSIPLFRELVVSSFECPNCHYKNSEIGSAMEISPQGIELELKVKTKEDLDRIVVKTTNALVRVPELDLEIPAKSQKGDVTTVEGVLRRVITGLQQDQPRRKEEHFEEYVKLEEYIKRVEDFIELKSPFSLVIRDSSGNSFIGRQTADPFKGLTDANLTITEFQRTKADNTDLGIDDSSSRFATLDELNELDEEEETKPTDEPVNLKDEIIRFSTLCPECGKACCTKMKVVDIPFFKEVIIMATDCAHCGVRSNEVKCAEGVEPKGKKITLKVKSKEDLNRDVLKTETCYIMVPELELHAGSGTTCGKFTTVEGLILDIKRELSVKNPLMHGDSVDPEMKRKMDNFIEKLDDLLTCEREFTVILDDPAGNCYLQNVYAPEEDPEMKIELYERTFEQNEELGLNDMDVGE